ncbi:EAL and GGDEF domain-containing protein [Rubrobacter indicoceani]|uniref:sensor domain-containing protein n=1 Tax=Rubrobacter indicoceani TaxID=2051957 RepID=UPI000E5AA364|nr:EAL domain-containing protein [Rubrobacter indicoceani]
MESKVEVNGNGAGGALSRLRLFESIVENANDAILVAEAEPVDEPGPRIVYANASFSRMTGYAAEEIIGKTPRILQGPKSERATLDKIRAALKAWRPVRVEVLNYRKSGEEFWVELDIVPVADETGWFTHWVSIQRDTTERKLKEQKRLLDEERFRSALGRYSSDFVAIVEADGSIRYLTPSVVEVLGYRPEEMVGAGFSAYVHPEDIWRTREVFAEATRAPGLGKPVEVRVKRKDGSWLHLEVIGNNLLDDSSVYGIVLNVWDVSERREAEEALRESEKRFRQLFEQSVDALLVHDREGWMVDCNSEACRSLGYSRKELLSLNVRDFATNLLSEEEKLTMAGRSLWERVLAGEMEEETSFHIGEHRRKDGTTFHVEVGVSAIERLGERLIFATARDVTERKAFEAELKYQAFHDALTGLPNRSMLMERLRHALERLRSGRFKPGESVAVIFMDLDNFKVVNDSLGHEAGDRLLVEVSDRLSACLRPGDTLARLGGDEFVILLENLASTPESGGEAAEVAVSVAQRVREALDEPFDIDSHEVLVTASLGVVVSSPGEDRADELLRDADLAMYAAKKNGKDSHKVFDPSMGVHALERLKLETDLRRALDGDEFVIYYQPKISLLTGEVVGTEALVRWDHPRRGLVSPVEFIPLAEETGLIVPLGLQVLEKACRQARRWQLDHPTDPALKMSVNLSARQFRQPGLIEDIRRVLRQTGVIPSSLILEITEGVLMEDAPATVTALDQLKNLGVGISVDDFGTGYSSLSYLRSFPVDYLKIDRSFVEDLKDDAEGQGIVTATIALAHTLGLQAVAEGVETEEQLLRLQELGCDFAQGFHLARPGPGKVVSDLLASRNHR